MYNAKEAEALALQFTPVPLKKSCGRPWTNLPLPVVHRCRNHLATILSSSLWSKIPDLPLESRRHICHSSGDINISRFGGHIAISGCRPTWESLADTFFALSMVM